MDIKIYKDKKEVAEQFSAYFVEKVKANDVFHVALPEEVPQRSCSMCWQKVLPIKWTGPRYIFIGEMSDAYLRQMRRATTK